MSEELERFVPGLQGEIWYEHWHRYHWVKPVVAGRRVLDAACGEGYGSALLCESAAAVTGVDVAQDVLAAARTRYGALANLQFLHGDLTKQLPLGDAAVDAVVSFETIEHFANQAAFVSEVARVLAPGGLFIVSSPNRAEYNAMGAPPNAFHEREMDETEFRALLTPHFPAQRWFAQDLDFHSLIAPWGREARAGETLAATSATAAKPRDRLDRAKYFLCVCAREPAALEAVADRLSVLADGERFILADYKRLNHAVGLWRAEREQLIARLQAAEQAVARLAVERNRALLAPHNDK